MIAASTEFASKATFGLFPKLLTTTRDQVDLLASDNVVSAEAEAEGRVLSALGVQPQAAEAIILSYLVRFRRTGQYEVLRSDVKALGAPPLRARAGERVVLRPEALTVCY